MLYREAMMMAARTETGRGRKRGPRDSITDRSSKADVRLVNWLLHIRRMIKMMPYNI